MWQKRVRGTEKCRELLFSSMCSSPRVVQYRPTNCGLESKRYSDTLATVREVDIGVIAADIVAGLAHLHSRGIIHCDISPDNIVVDTEVSPPRAVIIDLGTAQLDRGAKNNIAYKTPYRPPEIVWVGRDDAAPLLTPACDIYAAGVTLYLRKYNKYDQRLNLPINACPVMALSKIHPGIAHPARECNSACTDEHRSSLSAALAMTWEGVRFSLGIGRDWLDDIIVSMLHPDLTARPTAAALMAVMCPNLPVPQPFLPALDSREFLRAVVADLPAGDHTAAKDFVAAVYDSGECEDSIDDNIVAMIASGRAAKIITGSS